MFHAKGFSVQSSFLSLSFAASFHLSSASIYPASFLFCSFLPYSLPSFLPSSLPSCVTSFLSFNYFYVCVSSFLSSFFLHPFFHFLPFFSLPFFYFSLPCSLLPSFLLLSLQFYSLHEYLHGK